MNNKIVKPAAQLT